MVDVTGTVQSKFTFFWSGDILCLVLIVERIW